MQQFIKKYTPGLIKRKYGNIMLNKHKKYLSTLPVLDEKWLFDILQNELNLSSGDVVLCHTSLGNLNSYLSPAHILNLLIEIVGEKGTILFPTYPKQTSFDFLNRNLIFDIKRTPTYTGLINEFARRHPLAIRSLHPTKSVVAIGYHADFLIKDHQKSIYPYSEMSPYFKLSELNGKIIGLGVHTTNMSCVHCADDYLKEKFPVNPYHKKIFNAKCINYDNESVVVKTLAHNMNKMNFNIPKFIKNNIKSEICEDINIDGMRFFRANAKDTIHKIIELAVSHKTIYNRLYYKIG